MVDHTEGSRLYIPALGGLYEGLAGIAYPLLRFTCGALLVPHGWDKVINGTVTGTAGFMARMGFPAPEILAWYIAILELVGGVLLAIGLLTRPIALLVVGFMFVAAFVVHTNAWFWTDRGMEMPLLWLVVAIVIFIKGGGNWSVDKKLSKEF